MSVLSARSTRHCVAIPCQVVRERDFRLVADRVTNLSVGGMQVIPAEPVLTGERLIVSFRAPRWNIWIDAEAVVARVIHGRRAGEFCRALGIELIGVDDWCRLVLERTLESIPIAPPGPRPCRTGSSRSAVQRLAYGSGKAAGSTN